MASYASAERVKQIFLQADEDRNGVLSKDEVKKVIQKLANWDDETVEELMKQCDYNKDGSLQIREFVDFLFRGTRKEGEETREGMVNMACLMALHEAYYDDLKDIVHNYFRDRKINKMDFNFEEAWPDVVGFCEKEHVDVLTVDSDVIRLSVGDQPELWHERDYWIEQREIPEEKLFELLPCVKEAIEKSLNPLIALRINWCPPASPEAGVARVHRSIRDWKEGVKDILKRKENELEANERFKERVSMMEALIEASEAREKAEKEKALAEFKPLFDQLVAKAGWDEKKAQQVMDHLDRGNLYTQTWFIHGFSEGHLGVRIVCRR